MIVDIVRTGGDAIQDDLRGGKEGGIINGNGNMIKLTSICIDLVPFKTSSVLSYNTMKGKSVKKDVM